MLRRLLVILPLALMRLGAALAPIDGGLLGDVAVVSAASSDEFICTGDYAHKLPSDAQENLAYQCLVHFRAHVAPDMPAVKLELRKEFADWFGIRLKCLLCGGDICSTG